MEKYISADKVVVRKYIRILHRTPRFILMSLSVFNSAERYGAEVDIGGQ